MKLADKAKARLDREHAEKMLTQETQDRYRAYGWHLDVHWYQKMAEDARSVLAQEAPDE